MFVAQHFLLSNESRGLSMAAIARMSDAEAFDAFRKIRWSDNDGEPYCPKCNCSAVYEYRTRKLWKCQACTYQFSVTSRTIFAGRKLAIRDYLFAIAIFVNGTKGTSALQLSRDLNCQYKTAFVLAHKLREALGTQVATGPVSGEVEIDGCYIGGYAKPANYRQNRRDRRLFINQSGKRRVVVIMRERRGRVLPFVFGSEDQAIPAIIENVTHGSIIYADEASSWDPLHAPFDTRRINHSEAYSHDDMCTNLAESFFSRLRRAELGTHHRISGPYLGSYANEMAWRENHRRVSNDGQYYLMCAAALHHPVSRFWKGYWQRERAA
jgi:transposase-like protein